MVGIRYNARHGCVKKAYSGPKFDVSDGHFFFQKKRQIPTTPGRFTTGVFWYSPKGNFTRNAQNIYACDEKLII